MSAPFRSIETASVSCRAMSEHTETLAALAERLSSAKEYL
jgi:hypothetical protein